MYHDVFYEWGEEQSEEHKMLPTLGNRQELETFWTNYAKERLEGRTIVNARLMTDEEVKEFDWPCKTLVLELDNGTMILPSSDDEGNRPGALFGQGPNGESMTFPVV